MAVFECTSRVTRRSLMNRSKDELATRVLELHEEIGRVRAIVDREQAKAATTPAHVDLIALDTAREIVALDGRTFIGGDCQRKAVIQCAVISAIKKARPTRDADLPQVVSPCS